MCLYNGNTHYFNWAIFDGYVTNFKRVLGAVEVTSGTHMLERQKTERLPAGMRHGRTMLFKAKSLDVTPSRVIYLLVHETSK